MKENRRYLVTCGNGYIYALTPDQIDKDLDSGAGFKLIKIDGEGRAYLSDDKPTLAELYGYEIDNNYIKNEGRS